MKRKRSAKKFIAYNDYEERPFGLKWGTAFALSELTQSIQKGETKATKKVAVLPQMSRSEMDSVLNRAFTKQKKVSVQRNLYDDHDRLLESLEGSFQGFADHKCFYLDMVAISWDLVRNISIIEA